MDIVRDLCGKCETVHWMLNSEGRAKSFGVEWATCMDCKTRFVRPTEDEPLVVVSM